MQAVQVKKKRNYAKIALYVLGTGLLFLASAELFSLPELNPNLVIILGMMFGVEVIKYAESMKEK